MAWRRLAATIDGARSQYGASRLDCGNELRKRIQRLVAAEHCCDRAVAWVSEATGPLHRTEICVSRSADGAGSRHPAVRLNSLARLQDGALLSFLIVIDVRRGAFVGYSVSLEGVGRDDCGAWRSRIELDPHPRGQGLCGHPVLHCHVGGAANERTPEARVPLPWLAPWEALDWLLATADKKFETDPVPAG